MNFPCILFQNFRTILPLLFFISLVLAQDSNLAQKVPYEKLGYDELWSKLDFLAT